MEYAGICLASVHITTACIQQYWVVQVLMDLLICSMWIHQFHLIFKAFNIYIYTPLNIVTIRVDIREANSNKMSNLSLIKGIKTLSL